MAPVMKHRVGAAEFVGSLTITGEAARQSRAAWRHGHFAAKSAPQHRDFAAEKVEAIY
jgi:hypothetical protein